MELRKLISDLEKVDLECWEQHLLDTTKQDYEKRRVDASSILFLDDIHRKYYQSKYKKGGK